MEIRISDHANEQLLEWKSSGSIIVLKRIRALLSSIQDSPFEGIGKPEPLKHNYTGKWSRRITKADRLVYSVHDNYINVYSLKGHYK